MRNNHANEKAAGPAPAGPPAQTMPYPYGYCGMPCALCTRYRTQGTSRCPGCSHDGYYTDVCKVHHCCRDRRLAHCGLCGEFPCARLGRMGDFRDLNTGHVKQRTCAYVATAGFDPWYQEYEERAELLNVALARYNDGRMKRFLCELFIRQPMEVLRPLMREAESLTGEAKEAGKAFKAMALARMQAWEDQQGQV